VSREPCSSNESGAPLVGSLHSIATHLLDAGADLRFVQDWIGHASIGNTVIYAQLTSRRRDEEARKVFASHYVV
jgi:site-specific recombinase XerD